MIYISSACSKQKKICDAIEEFVAYGFKNIELTGGTSYYENYEHDLLCLKEKYDLSYLIHNYFPPAREEFVLNLASLDDGIFQRTLNNLHRAMRLSKIIGAPKLSFHAGFFIDVELAEVGKCFHKKPLSDRKAAIRRFHKGFEQLLQEADGIQLYVENNVYSCSNYETYGDDTPFMLLGYHDYAQLKKDIPFKLLLDFGHLNVTANTLKLNRDEEFKKMFAVSDYIHISDNDGRHDLNLEFTEGGQLYHILKKYDLRKKTITLEIYDGLDAVARSYGLLSSIITRNSLEHLTREEQIVNMSVPLSGTLREVLRALDKTDLGTVLLVDSVTQMFKGVITYGDMRRYLLDGYGLNTPVADIPSQEAIWAPVNTPLDEISKMFTSAVRVIPLLDDKKKIVDIVIVDKREPLPVAEPSLNEKELMYVNECVLTGWVSSAGKFVTRFEEMFAEFCGVRHAIATCNGTAALHLALLAAGVGPGDEVIIPSLTFIATANAVTYTGAKPVFVDSEDTTWNIDPEAISTAITSVTKAIIPVHLYGHPANMGPILELARRHGLAVIEDAAEAHGARYHHAKVGSFGDMGVFSFFGNKIVTTGEGGMVTTDSDGLAEKIRILRNHGMDKNRRYWHPLLGYNYRLTNIQAALGVAQMEKIDYILSKKRILAQIYEEGLKDIAGLTLPFEAHWAQSVFWMYSILIDEEIFNLSRDGLIDVLREKRIETRPFFPPVHMQPIYATGQRLPVSERLAAQGLNLPSSVNLSIEDIQHIITAIKNYAP